MLPENHGEEIELLNKQILIVAHTPSENTKRLAEGLTSGCRLADSAIVHVELKSPFETDAHDLVKAAGIILMTPENLGYMSGALKDLFDRAYYPCLEHTQGRPYALVIRAGQDGTGTALAVRRITTGLRWRPVAEPLICKGPWQEQFVEDCQELGQAMAEGLDAGIF